MTITKKYLRDWENNMRTIITADQERAILERFGTEPEPYAWSDRRSGHLHSNTQLSWMWRVCEINDRQ